MVTDPHTPTVAVTVGPGGQAAGPGRRGAATGAGSRPAGGGNWRPSGRTARALTHSDSDVTFTTASLRFRVPRLASLAVPGRRRRARRRSVRGGLGAGRPHRCQYKTL